MNIASVLIGAVAISIGVFVFLAKDLPCEKSITGGSTNQYECIMKTVLGMNCTWDEVNQVCKTPIITPP